MTSRNDTSSHVDGSFTVKHNIGSTELNLQGKISSELTNYQLPGILLATSPDHPIDAVQDNTGNPIIFAVTEGKGLTVILQGTASNYQAKFGWEALSIPTPGSTEIVTFTTSQNRQGDIVLAVVVRNTDGRHELLVSDSLSNETGKKERWQRIKWTPKRDKETHEIKTLYLGTNDDGKGSPLLIAGTQDLKGDSQAQHYQIDTTPAVSDGTWHLFAIPEDSQEIVSMAIGSHPYGRGVYTLFRSAGILRTIFSTIDNKRHVEIHTPKACHTLSALPSGRKGYTDLYMGGDGVKLVPTRYQRSKYAKEKYTGTVIPETKVANINEMLIREDAGSIVLWIRDREKQLHYVKGRKSAQLIAEEAPTKAPHSVLQNVQDDDLNHEGTPLSAKTLKEQHSDWEEPIVLRQNISRLAPIRNRNNQANVALLQSESSQFVQLNQRPQDHLWLEQDIALPDDGSIRTADAFVTNINLYDESGAPYFPGLDPSKRSDQDTNPLTPLSFSISASAQIQLEVNGEGITVSPKQSTRVQPNERGNITIMAKTDSLASTHLYLESDALSERLVINPGTKLQNQLKKIKSGNDLKKAKTADGSPLIDSSKLKHTDQAAELLGQMTSMADELPEDGSLMQMPLAAKNHLDEECFYASYQPELGMQTALGQEAIAAMNRSIARDAPNYFASSETSKLLQASAPNASLDHQELLGNWFTDAIKKLAGDVIEWAKNKLKEGFELLKKQVAGVWQLAVKIGSEVFSFAVECASQAYKAVDWLLEHTLGLNLSKIMSWAGFIFNWDDILGTQSALEAGVKHALNYAEMQAESLSQQIGDFFDSVIQQLDNYQESTKDVAALRRTQQEQLKQQQDEAPPEANSAISFANDSPGGQYANFIMHESGLGDAKKMNALFSNRFEHLEEDGLLKANPMERIASFFASEANKHMQSFEKSGKDLGETFKGLFEGRFTTDEFISLLLSDTGKAMLRAGSDIATGMVNLFKEVIAIFKDILFQPINVPLITPLYKMLTKGKELTLMSAFALVFAIPATCVYKLLTGKAPFPKDGGEIAKMSTDTFIAQVQSYRPEQKMTSAELAAEEMPMVIKVYHWIGDLVVGIANYVKSAIMTVAGIADQLIPAALSAPFNFLEIALTIPLGKWTIGNIAGWAASWIGLIVTIYSAAFPGESKLGALFKLVVMGVIKFLLQTTYYIYQVVSLSIKQAWVQLGYATSKVMSDACSSFGFFMSGVAGLIPHDGKVTSATKLAVVGISGISFTTGTGITMYRAAARILTDNLIPEHN